MTERITSIKELERVVKGAFDSFLENQKEYPEFPARHSKEPDGIEEGYQQVELISFLGVLRRITAQTIVTGSRRTEKTEEGAMNTNEEKFTHKHLTAISEAVGDILKGE